MRSRWIEGLERISKSVFGRAKLLLSRVSPCYWLGRSLALPGLKPLLGILLVSMASYSPAQAPGKPAGFAQWTAERQALVGDEDVDYYEWVKVALPAAFAPRDGAGALVYDGRMWLLGGWNPGDQVHFPRICNNEVWGRKYHPAGSYAAFW